VPNPAFARVQTRRTARHFPDPHMSPRFLLRFLRDRRNTSRWEHAFALLRLSLLRHSPRRHRGWVKIIGYTMHYADFELFRVVFQEMFIHRIYELDSVRDGGLIIDAGSNIGISVLYFAWRYPTARIIAFEPEPSNHDILLKNIMDNDLRNVTVHRCALHDHDGAVNLYVRGGIAGGDIGASTEEQFRYAHHRREDIDAVSVPCRRLSSVLEELEKVDLLKLDIEGSEGIVLQECASVLDKVEHLVMEYHYMQGSNPLSRILSILEEHGYTYALHGDDPGSALQQVFTLIIKAERAVPS
jgi:FkbM family methyltransferase